MPHQRFQRFDSNNRLHQKVDAPLTCTKLTGSKKHRLRSACMESEQADLDQDFSQMHQAPFEQSMDHIYEIVLPNELFLGVIIKWRQQLMLTFIAKHFRLTSVT